MKIIDQTPFYDEKGEINLVDRGKALMKYGAGWFKEIEGQKAIITVLDTILDKKFTLLRNITPPGLDTMIPFILVGPTGVFVMSVTALAGTYRARGDQWGTITGSTFKPEKPNMLTRTDRMARAVQVFLKRQGYSELENVESILLCSDPATHIDSMRPIIRVIMRDALERFAVSIAQGRVIFSQETVFDIVNRIQHPPAPEQPKPAVPEAQVEEDEPFPVENEMGMTRQPLEIETTQAASRSEIPSFMVERDGKFEEAPGKVIKRPKRKAFTRKQMLLLVIMAVIWCLIMAVLLFLVGRDALPLLLP
jgi:hypothetical protein